MEKLKNILESSSLPGISNLFRTRKFLIKLIWIASFFTLIGFCVYFAKDSSSNYFEHEIITNINLISEKHAQFPAVSVCITNSPDKHPKLNDILEICLFDTNECDSENDFEEYIIQPNETCYRFNTGKKNQIKNMSVADPTSGLQLLLNIEKLYFDSIYAEVTPFKAAVFIQNQSNIFRRDQTYLIESGFQIPAGFNYFSIEREFVEKLAMPYNDCIKQNEININEFKLTDPLYQYFIQNNKSYLQKDCLDLCIEQVIIKKCNCHSQLLGSLQDCDQTDCVDNLIFNYTSQKLHIPNNCLEKCKPECDLNRFKIAQNHISIISDEYKAIYNITANDMDKSVYINVYYSDLKYTIMKQIPKMSLIDLISNLGGLLGLFVGISFLTFIEIIQICLEMIFHIISNKNYKKNKIIHI